MIKFVTNRGRLIGAAKKQIVSKTAAAKPQHDASAKIEIDTKEPVLEKTEDVDFDMTLPEVKIPLETSDSSSDSDDSDGQKEFEAEILGEKIEENKPKEQEEVEISTQEEPTLNEIPKKQEISRENSSIGSSDDSSVDFDPEKELQKSLTEKVENNEQESKDETSPPPKPRRLSLVPSPIQLRAQKTLSVDSQGSILTQDSQSKEEFALDENSSDETEIKDENLDKPPNTQKSEKSTTENKEDSKKEAPKKQTPKNAGMTFREVRKHYGVVNSKIKNELKLQKGDRVQIVNFSEEQEVFEIRIPRTDENGNFPKKYLNFEEKLVRYESGSFYNVAFSYEPNTDKLLPLKRDEEIQILQIPENGKYILGKNKSGKGQLLLEDLCDDLLKAGRVPEGAREPKKLEAPKAAPKSEKPKKRRCILL
ncbi:unnamed protein product [Oikopleura dioica]|uniref:SH3 domain-containing protein n=1 Tax=Oikopleura dioica TaxID=34765 RepID=E4X6C8_OIKDI|nr:unnamed protein product [Oikopleura dioica]